MCGVAVTRIHVWSKNTWKAKRESLDGILIKGFNILYLFPSCLSPSYIISKNN